MNCVDIKDLANVLKCISNSDKVVHDIKCERLLPTGENFGSILYKVVITTKNDTDEKVLHLVAKLIPKEKFLQVLFDVQNTVKKEIAFYEEIVPAIQRFQRQNGIENVIDFFPKYYGSRINLNGSDVVDEDSVILLENLKETDFKNADRFLGYNLTEAKLIFKHLATFHSTTIALKLQSPEEYEKYIRRRCGKFRQCPLPPKIPGREEETGENLYYTVFYENDKCLPYINRVKELMKPITLEFVAREPFATLAHSDCWLNNQMIRYENGQPMEIKLIDFQLYGYNSPTVDLFICLWTSVQKSILENHLDDLLHYYHSIFIDNLKAFHCDTELFQWKYFMEEFTYAAKISFGHAMFMLFFITFGKTDDSMPNFGISSKDISLEVKEKIWYTLQECGKRNWI